MGTDWFSRTSTNQRMASTVVIGAGVLGASAAFHLARRGARDVLVVDRAGEPGRGATARALGLFVSQHSNPVDIQLSLLSRDRLLALRRDTGIDPGYRTVGRISLAESIAELETLRANLRIQQALGLVEAMELDEERIGWLHPALERSGLAGAIFSPTDGTIRPTDVLRAYIAAASRLGVTFEWNVDVHEVERGADGLVTGVRTSGGVLEAARIVNAAGPWAGALGHSCDLALPVTPACRAVAITAPTGALPIGAPVTTFAAAGLDVIARDGRIALSSAAPAGGPAPRGPGVDDRWLSAVLAVARARLPLLAEVPVDRAQSWTGLEAATPDGRAIVGPHPAAPNYFLVCGGSAAGVMHAPALGHVLASLVVDGHSPGIDVGSLTPGRFTPHTADV